MAYSAYSAYSAYGAWGAYSSIAMMCRFGVFEFDGDSGELRKNGRVVALEPQPAKALALLLARGGEIVSREQLRDAVWGEDTHVDFDRGLAYCISQIRTTLGDSGDNPRFVQPTMCCWVSCRKARRGSASSRTSSGYATRRI